MALGALYASERSRLLPTGARRSPQAWAALLGVELETRTQRSPRAMQRVWNPKRFAYLGPRRPTGTLERLAPVAGRPLTPTGKLRDTVVARARFFQGGSHA